MFAAMEGTSNPWRRSRREATRNHGILGDRRARSRARREGGEEWACKLTMARRHEIYRAYRDVLKALRESVDLDELAALRETLLT